MEKVHNASSRCRFRVVDEATSPFDSVKVGILEQFSFLRDRLDALWRVVDWFADHFADWVSSQIVRCQGNEDFFKLPRIGKFWIQPEIECVAMEDDGHTVVKRRHRGVGFGGENGTGLDDGIVQRVVGFVFP